MTGTVLNRIMSNNFRVELENGTIITAKKVSRFHVSSKNIVEGDKVLIEIPLNQSKMERGDIVGFVTLPDS